MQTLTLTRPDDWHIHLRDHDKLERTVVDAARCFRRVIVMPNLVPPISSVQDADDYRKRIMSHLPQEFDFNPLMSLYLTDNTTANEIKASAEHDHIFGCKLYPAGATTNSDSGVTDVSNIYPTLEAMEKYGLVLQVHGEVTDTNIDIFDREKVFIETILHPLSEKFPNLKIVLEHITTSDAVNFVSTATQNIAATITAHHLLFNRNDMLAGGIRPDYYCLPILKKNEHQQALIKAAISGNPKFFLGTDSAPHATTNKYSACGCAGCYTANSAIELYAEAFEQADALNMLEGFASHFGADFYQLPRNNDSITLIKSDWQIPNLIQFGEEQISPLLGGETLSWQLVK